MTSPDVVVCGHAVRDIVPGGWRAGGTVTFAAVQADRLGYSVGVVTRAAADFDLAAQIPFAEIVQLPSQETTTFENVYERGHRRQRVRAQAGSIVAEDVPADWRAAPIVLAGPVFGEIGADFAGVFADESLVGVSAQGWLRSLDDEGNVVRRMWEGPPFWRGADVVFVSDEDLPGGRGDAEPWTADVPVLAMTESRFGAQIWLEGGWQHIPAFPEDEVDATGAGDTFAMAFLIGLHETGDARFAARFGAAAASISVGGVAAEKIPGRAEIEERMRRYPEVVLR